jgi:hypothetical protein
MDIVRNIERKLENVSSKFERMVPWFKNYKGSVTAGENPGTFQL